MTLSTARLFITQVCAYSVYTFLSISSCIGYISTYPRGTDSPPMGE